jgi:hypothetical protein
MEIVAIALVPAWRVWLWLCEAAESHNENVDVALYAADEWVLEEGCEPRGGDCSAFHALQLLPVHQTLRLTPPMEAGIADHIWSVEQLVSLMEPKSILGGLERAS